MRVVVSSPSSLTGRQGRVLALFTTLAVGAAGAGPGACSKKTPEVQTAQAVSATPTASAAEKPAAEKPTAPGAEDTTPPPGIDLAALDEFERKVFFRIVNKEASACGKGHSLIHSVKNDRACRKSFYAVRYVTRLVDGGFTDSEITDMLDKRFRTPAQRIDVATAPTKGNPSARVAVVEFVDFECPHCKRIQPVLSQVLAEFRDDVKVVHKNYPLGQHTNARKAAVACVAAHRQGKFWPYAEKVWANSDFITPALLEKIAGEVGLDVAKWRADFESPDTEAQVERDKAEGGQLGIRSTPAIFVNGRLFSDSRDADSLRDWITEELGR
jgi:protein-disulfide isomerase